MLARRIRRRGPDRGDFSVTRGRGRRSAHRPRERASEKTAARASDCKMDEGRARLFRPAADAGVSSRAVPAE